MVCLYFHQTPCIHHGENHLTCKFHQLTGRYITNQIDVGVVDMQMLLKHLTGNLYRRPPHNRIDKKAEETNLYVYRSDEVDALHKVNPLLAGQPPLLCWH
jgi:hypothetical protein